jgi:hypothetical protein
MSLRLRLLPLVASAIPALAWADPRIAYVDEVRSFGGVDPGRARALVEAALARADLAAGFGDAPPCGGTAEVACLAERGRRAGAVIALRVTVAEVAGELVLGAMVVDLARRDTRREIIEGLDPVRPDDRFVALLRVAEPAARRRPRYAAWTFAVGAGALAVSGALVTGRALSLRSDFFTNHVAPNGDVFGISPRDARAAEDRARAWSLAGGLLLAGAGVAGVTATVLFVAGRDSEVRPAGIAIGGSL